MIERNWTGLLNKQPHKDGNIYQNPERIEREYEKQNRKKIIHSAGFKSTGMNTHVGGLFTYPDNKDGVYEDSSQIKRNYEKQQAQKIIHQSAFRATAKDQQIVNSSYLFIDKAPKMRNPRDLRDEEVSGFFSKVEYKEDDFTRKKRMLLSEYNAHMKKTFARGLFHNKITVPNETFTANQAIFGPADPSPVTAGRCRHALITRAYQLEELKQRYLKEQALLNCKKMQQKVAAASGKEEEDGNYDQPKSKKAKVYTYVTPPYICSGFDTRIFARHRELKEKLAAQKKNV